MICKNNKCKAELLDEALYCHLCGKKQQEPTKARRTRANGTGTAYKRGTTWTAKTILGWKQSGEKWVPVQRTKGGFKTKREALEYIPVLRKEKPKQLLTLDKIYQGWSTSAMLKLSKSKQTAYKIAYRKIEDIRYIDITMLGIDDLQNCVDDNTNSYYTARDVRTLISYLYARAQAQGYVQSNLSEFITIPSLDEKETVPFSRIEQTILWKDYSAGNTFAGYALLMIYTGMMPGELLKAEKSMINWQEQQIAGCGLKTKKRKETPIVLPDIIIPVLSRLCEESKGDKILDVGRDDFYDAFSDMVTRLNLNPELRPYSCRHSTATALDEAEIPPSIIKEVMRHTKFSTTEKYIHKDLSPVKDALNRLQAPVVNILSTKN